MWQLWQQNLGLDQLIEQGKVLCWSSKFLDSRKQEFRRHDDKYFLQLIWDQLNEADAVISYNGRRFDIPWLNTEFIKAGMTPPSPYKHIDLLESVKKQFKFASNKLQNILVELKVGEKKDHEGFPMWIKCLANDKTAWKDMESYNRQDVRETIKLYEKLKPWLWAHPNYNMYSDEPICTTCGSKHLERRGPYRSQVGLYQKFVCKTCGHWNRSRFTEVEQKRRKTIIVSAT